ncbi:MAG: hypothetical protein PVI30_20610 [Myxococcales bacterium]
MDGETDYLVVGAGLAGLAFLDTLLEGDAEATAVIVDRRHAPGGHWLDAYPFVRLHLPSMHYGVASMPLGQDRIVTHGPAAGRYECASGAEICGYFDQVMQHRLLSSGRVRFLPRHEHLGEGRVRSLVTGRVQQLSVRRRTVDAAYLEGRVPAACPPPFEVAGDATCIPPGELVRRDGVAEGYVVVGASKTAIDTCLWLLDQGVDPERIRWIRPRDTWLLNRKHYQGGRFVTEVVEGLVAQLESAAVATDVHDFFEGCEAAGVMMRVDPAVRPTMMRGATCDAHEVKRLRSIEQVIRMGHVLRIEGDRIVLEGGEVPTSRRQVHVHCAAVGIPTRPPMKIFQPGRIVMQHVRQVTPPFSFALIGLVEASGRDDTENNRLVHPNAGVTTPLDWVRAMVQGMAVERGWRREPDIESWKRGTRLNVSKGAEALADTEGGAALMQRMRAAVGPGLAGMRRMLETATDAERRLFWPPAAG